MSFFGDPGWERAVAGVSGGASCALACRALLERIGPSKVIEVGTAYGEQLETFAGLATRVVCVDPMYEWVPDVPRADGFDPARVDWRKVDAWWRRAARFGGDVVLVVGSSHLVHAEPDKAELFSGAKVLLVDGNHSGQEDVADDYRNFAKFLDVAEHFVVWDDVGVGDVDRAVKAVRAELEQSGRSVEESPFGGARAWRVRP